MWNWDEIERRTGFNYVPRYLFVRTEDFMEAYMAHVIEEVKAGRNPMQADIVAELNHIMLED